MRVGVIGGGQLARMMVPPAVALGIELHVLAEAEGSSAGSVDRLTTVGSYEDADTVLAWADAVDVVTFDHEHVPQPVLARLVEAGVAVRPGPSALLAAQDKVHMRERLTALGVPCPAWAVVHDEAEVAAFLAAHGGEVVVKTPRGGYDGRGVRIVQRPDEVADWLATDDGQGLLVEELVAFTQEVAQQVARRPSGDIAGWPLVETVQLDGICAEVTAPSNLAADQAAEALAIARTVAEGLDVSGCLAVELFAVPGRGLLVNELAMRPHNSGHWTIDGATTSQFEQHLRAVLDLPLGDTTPTAPYSVMVNVLGDGAAPPMPQRYGSVMAAHPDVHIHCYGKEPRRGRKLGHVTATGPDGAAASAAAWAAATAFGSLPSAP